jgi:hypothetical protein
VGLPLGDGYNIMRNIKLTFEHPNYIYPFKISLFNSNDPERIHQVHTNEVLNNIRHQLILTSEEEKILDSLSIGKLSTMQDSKPNCSTSTHGCFSNVKMLTFWARR